MQNNLLIFSIFTFLSTTFTNTAIADENTFNNNLKALQEVHIFCDSPKRKGNSETYNIQIEGKAAASRIVKNLIDLGFGVRGQATGKKYDDVLQEDLLAALSEANKCKKDTLQAIKDYMIVKPPAKGSVATYQGADGSISTSAATDDLVCTAYAGPDGAGTVCKNKAGEIKQKNVSGIKK